MSQDASDYALRRSMLIDAIVQALDDYAQASEAMQHVMDNGNTDSPGYHAMLEQLFEADQRITCLREAWTRVSRSQPQQS